MMPPLPVLPIAYSKLMNAVAAGMPVLLTAQETADLVKYLSACVHALIHRGA